MELSTQTLDKETINNLPVDTAIAFSNFKGIHKKGIEKRQRKLLGELAFLGRFLNEDETILLVTKACSPASFLEQYLAGWMIYTLKRCYIVVTNMRILHVPTTYNYKYRNTIAQVLYSDVTAAKGGGSLKLSYKNGKKETFFSLDHHEKKKLKTLLGKMKFEVFQSQTPGRTHLCPRCKNELKKEIYKCPSCELGFKNKSEGKMISIKYPGGGYFYTGHYVLGALDAIVESVLIVLFFIALLKPAMGHTEAIWEIIIFGLLLAYEKAVTIYETNKFIEEYIPIGYDE